MRIIAAAAPFCTCAFTWPMAPARRAGTAAEMGGLAAVQDFWKLYLVPAQGHGGPNGTTHPAANPPIVAAGQMYALLTAWVEQGTAPDDVVLQTPESAATQKSRPICVYPKKATYGSGDPNVAASYTCS